VPDDVSPLDARVAHHRQHITRERYERVRLHLAGLVRAAVSAQVGHDHAEAGRGQRRDLMSPEPASVGKPMQQDDWAAVADHFVFDSNATNVNAHLTPQAGRDRRRQT
jgi:hypothetical protein